MTIPFIPNSLQAWLWLGIRVLAVLGLLYLTISWCVRMPGRSHTGPLDPLDDKGRELSGRLRQHVQVLAGTIGPRHLFGAGGELVAAADYVAARFRDLGFHPALHSYVVAGTSVANIEIVIPGTNEGTAPLLIGAHYDTVPRTPGADDNASGVAVLLELARLLSAVPLEDTVRMVAFVNEEPPFFKTRDMGSRVYARQARSRGTELGPVIILESLGLYSDAPGSQHYPPPFSLFYPDTANFIAFIGNLQSRRLVRKCTGLFRRHAAFPAEGAALPGWVTGVDWSDHWSFWQEGYEAVMVTDTALFRSDRYHTPQDTPDTLDYDRMAVVCLGLERMLRNVSEKRVAQNR